MRSDAAIVGCSEGARGGGEAADFYYLVYNNFDREGPGGANVYILCLEEFNS